jgi:N-acetyl-beta-hexosaminidase
MNLLPWPKEITYGAGSFELNRKTALCLEPGCGRREYDAASMLQKDISRLSILKPGISFACEPDRANRIQLFKKDVAPFAYTLDVRPDGIDVAAGTDENLFYGVQTLRQLIASAGLRIPELSIRDFADFPNRGFMHDVTRGKVPKLDTLKDLADRAAYYKLNQLQLYIEHTFAFQNMSEVWRDADPLTAEEILELDDYCTRRYIELVPTIATFGHLYEVLRSKSFRHLCELEIDGSEPFTWPDRQLHHTLDVSNPESFVLARGMLDEFLPLFSSTQVNICCDETFDLGEGKNRELAQRVGKGRLYMDFLLKIIGHAKSLGKTVMFWDDILLEHPDYLGELPKDVICLTWQYAAEVQEEKFQRIHDTGLRQYVCPGVSAWNRLAADMENATANIVGSAAYAKKYSAVGLLNTDWGDYGHVNLLSASLPGMILGACAAWNGDAAHDAAQPSRCSASWAACVA